MSALEQAQQWLDSKFEDLESIMPKSHKLDFNERTALYDRIKRLTKNGKDYYGSLKTIRSITLQRRQTKGIKKRVVAYDRAISKMEGSRVGIGEAFGDAIPENERNLITAAEAGEHIEVGLDAAMMISKLNGDIRKALGVAMIYPVAIFLIVIGALAFFGQGLLPQFAGFKPIDEWEPLGQKLYYVATTVQYWAPAVFLFFFALVFGFIYTLHRWVGEKREQVDEAVVFYNINKTIQSSIFLISLSAYLRSGIPFVNAFNKIKKESNSDWIIKNVDAMLLKSRTIGDLGDAMVVPMFDDDTKEDLAIYSRSTPKQFTEALAEIGEKGIQRSLDRINKIATSVKFFLSLIGAATILGMYISILSVANNIQG